MDEVTKPTAVIISPDGVSEIRNYASYQAIRTPKVKLGARMKLLIPWTIYVDIVGLFKRVNAIHRSEAVVYVWRREADNMMTFTVPEQYVSGARAEVVDTTLTPPEPEGWVLFAHIHSHNTMGAFFSGTDDSGEKQDGLVYGVVGKITDYVPESKWRVRAMGEWMELTLGDCVSMPALWSEPGAELLTQIKPESARPKGSSQQGVVIRYPSVDKRRVGRKRGIDIFPIIVIRTDGTVWHEWRDRSLTTTGMRVEEMKKSEREEALLEGDDWTPTALSKGAGA